MLADSRAPGLRLLTVTHFFESHGGGIEIVAGRLAREFARLGNTSQWAASAADAPPDDGAVVVLPLATVDPLERITGLPMPLLFPAAVVRLWSAVRRADGVVIHDALYVSSIVSALAAKLAGKRFVLVQHVGVIPFASPLLRCVMRLAFQLVARPMMRAAAQTVFISETVRRQFDGLGTKTPPITLFNGVDTDLFRPEPDAGARRAGKTAFGLLPDRTTLLFVGRFVEKKGLSVLHEIAQAMPQCDFVLVGAGPMQPKTWGIDNVFVFDPLPPPSLAQLYRCVDGLVLPSVGEGFPLVVQEAMASGLPVFCGDETARADPGASNFLTGIPVDLNAPKTSAAEFVVAIDRHDFAHRNDEASVYARSVYSWPRYAAALMSFLAGSNDPSGGGRLRRSDLATSSKPLVTGRQPYSGATVVNDNEVALDCVGFLIRVGDAVLAERRLMSKPVMPGALAIPGGHVETGESLDEALRRELKEELNIVPRAHRLVCVHLHRSQELRRLHYFAIDACDGDIENHEAASLHWVPVDDLDRLDLEVDRLAVTSFLAGASVRG